MEFIKTELEDCYILKPKRFGDERGYFESVTKSDLEKIGFKDIYQVSNSFSSKGVLRGLHFQKEPYSQAKLVRCHKGRVLDVVVDIRKDSNTYGKYIAVELSSENGNILYVPRGFAHGYLALEKDSLFEYYVDNDYAPRLEDGIAWDDAEISIPWDEIFKKYGIENPILSDKDKVRHSLSETKEEYLRKPKRFLITGVKGQLGYDIEKELRRRGEDIILAIDKEDMDITDAKQVNEVINYFKPDVIFHCAAYTAVDKAEMNDDDARKVNYVGTRNITEASINVGAKLVYMSTDYIFDGTKEGLYTEYDIPNPKSVYGETKLMGEVEVRKNPKYFITRISWVFGINGNNFIKTMLRLSDTHDTLNVVDDQKGSPTYTVDLAKLLVEMAYTDKYGTYNVTNDGYCSWAEFAKYIMEVNEKNTIINPISTEEYKQISNPNQAERPKNSKLDKTKLVENGFSMLPDWHDAVERYSKELSKVKVLKKQ